ncbi:MAG: endonuclease/exonuclease/phosphatase family protein [Patescibacteria group bacterium]
MTNHYESRTINVISLNAMLDKKRTDQGLILPQDERVQSLAATINNFSAEKSVVGVQEVFKSAAQHNGEVLAELCGYGPGFCVEHNQRQNAYPGDNRGRADEYLLMFGELVDRVDDIDLGDCRHAALADIGGIAIAMVHPRAGRSLKARSARKDQMITLVDALSGYESAVVFGDLNEPPVRYVSAGRDYLGRHGFRSANALLRQPYPRTYPTDAYKEIRGITRPLPLDDILVRGERVRVLAAGVLEAVTEQRAQTEKYSAAPMEASDHVGVFATLDLGQI